MMQQDWGNLAITSIKDPASAARTLMGLGLPTGFLWNALVLVAVGNTFLFVLSDMLLGAGTPLPGVFNHPLVYFAIVAGGLSLTAVSIHWTGRKLGGKGSLGDILVLVVWMQALRLAVQLAVLVLVFVAPLFSALLVFAAALIGVYMLVHFVDQAHRFNSPGRAAVVLIASLLAIVVGLSLVLSVIGGLFIGSVTDV